MFQLSYASLVHARAALCCGPWLFWKREHGTMHGRVSAQEALVMAVSSSRGLRGASSALQRGSRTLHPRTQRSFPLPSLRSRK